LLLLERQREEQRHQRCGDPIVQPALDVQRPADPHRHATIGEDRQPQRGVGRSQDGADQEREAEPFRGKQPNRRRRAQEHGQRHADQ
jgi:hypothetical protein